MVKSASLFLLIICSSLLSADFNKYTFTPLLVNESFNIDHIDRNQSGNIIVSGYSILGDDPKSQITNTVLLKSKDNGANWTVIYSDSNENLPQEKRYFYNIDELRYLDNGTILAFVRDGVILRSSDGGITWVKDSLGLLKTPMQVKFINSQNGVAHWYKSFDHKINSILYYTNDGGNSWKEIKVPLNDLFEYTKVFLIGKFYYSDEGVISFCMSDDRYEGDSLIESKKYLISTKDYGETWEKEIFNLPVKNSIIQFIDENHIILFGILPSKTHFDNSGNPFGHDIVLESFDRGLTWDTLLINLDTNVNSKLSWSFEYFDNNFFLLQGNNSGISFFERGGDEIATLFPNNLLELRNKYGFQNLFDYIRLGDTILATAGGGYLFYIDYKNPISSVEDIIYQSEINTYPNPAKGKINVKFYTEARNRIKDLKVSLVNIASGKEQEIKDYDMSFSDNWNGEITFDISGYSVGSYLLNLSIGDYSRNTKLIISR